MACQPIGTVARFTSLMDSHGGTDERGGESFDDFFARMLPRAISLARRVTGDPWTAEDVAVEAMAKAHVRWTRVGSLDWRDAWLLKVTSRESLRHLKQHPPLPPPRHADDEADAVVLRRALAAAL
ncbi:MAG TPA: sigma factor, partial [Acidimicrobiales bacterium]|nr:sigma factor [Acidimicrobiales bacterium]